MMKVTPLTQTPAGNPFHHDAFRMGNVIGKNVAIMFEKFDHERQPYIIVVNTETGERLRITLDESERTLA